MAKKTAEKLLEFIKKSPTCYQVIQNISESLDGFSELFEDEKWNLERGKNYFVTRNGSSLIAFRVPEKTPCAFQMALAHSDFPLLKLKPEFELKKGRFLLLNIEKYGGLIASPWFDRPLSLAGRVIVKKENCLETIPFDLKKDVALIPNLAIHMTKSPNEKEKINPQVEMLPVAGNENTDGALLKLIAKSTGIKATEIAGADLFLYNNQQGKIWGVCDEYISSRSLDDLQCAWTVIQGLKNTKTSGENIALCGIFDNEEVGSSTRQGADSTFLSDTLERIAKSLDFDLKIALAKSFAISADNAHGVHPNYSSISDPTNRPQINEGIVIKYNANQKYTTDGFSEAVFKSVCEKADVPYQTFANRSDMPGGSTLGNISTGHVSVATVDIGLPQLAMHSPYETAGVKDTEYLLKVITTYFGSTVKINSSGKCEIE